MREAIGGLRRPCRMADLKDRAIVPGSDAGGGKYEFLTRWAQPIEDRQNFLSPLSGWPEGLPDRQANGCIFLRHARHLPAHA